MPPDDEIKRIEKMVGEFSNPLSTYALEGYKLGVETERERIVNWAFGDCDCGRNFISYRKDCSGCWDKLKGEAQ